MAKAVKKSIKKSPSLDKLRADAEAGQPMASVPPSIVAPEADTSAPVHDWVEPFPGEGMVLAHTLRDIRINGTVLAAGNDVILDAKTAHSQADALTGPKGE